MAAGKPEVLIQLREIRTWLDREDVIKEATDKGGSVLKDYLNTRTENAVAINVVEKQSLEEFNQKLEPLSDRLEIATADLKKTIDKLNEIKKTLDTISTILGIVAKAVAFL